MCCQITVTPLDIELAQAILATGQFLPTDAAIPHMLWRRDLGLDETAKIMAVRVVLSPYTTIPVMHLYIEPSITTYEQHIHRRIPASVALEIAAKYAERVDGLITEHANVMGCSTGGIRQHVIAQYPHIHLDYSLLCNGYKEAFDVTNP